MRAITGKKKNSRRMSLSCAEKLGCYASWIIDVVRTYVRRCLVCITALLLLINIMNYRVVVYDRLYLKGHSTFPYKEEKQGERYIYIALLFLNSFMKCDA